MCAHKHPRSHVSEQPSCKHGPCARACRLQRAGFGNAPAPCRGAVRELERGLPEQGAFVFMRFACHVYWLFLSIQFLSFFLSFFLNLFAVTYLSLAHFYSQSCFTPLTFCTTHRPASLHPLQAAKTSIGWLWCARLSQLVSDGSSQWMQSNLCWSFACVYLSSNTHTHTHMHTHTHTHTYAYLHIHIFAKWEIKFDIIQDWHPLETSSKWHRPSSAQETRKPASDSASRAFRFSSR